MSEFNFQSTSLSLFSSKIHKLPSQKLKRSKLFFLEFGSFDKIGYANKIGGV